MGNPIPSRDAREAAAPDARLLEAAQGIVAAWESLPGPRRYTVREVQEWLVGPLTTAINNLRAALSDQPDSTNDGLAELLRECRKDFDRCADIVDRHLYRQSEKVEDVRLIALSAVTRIDTALATGRQA